MARLIDGGTLDTPAREQASHPVPGVPTLPPGARPNKYGAKCPNCGGWVEPEAGRLDKIDGKWVVSHIQPCPAKAEAPVPAANRIADGAAAANIIYDGDYTLEREDHHRTFRIRVQDADDEFKPGQQIVSYLSGPDNENDYTRFGHLFNGRLYIWRKFQGNTTLVADAQALMADPASALAAARCFSCHRKLTVPASVHAGYGPECIKQQ